MKSGYGWVSTRDQNPTPSTTRSRACSWTRPPARWPELDKALMVTRGSVQLVVTKLDRHGRSLEHLISLYKSLQERCVNLVMLDQGIDTSNAVGRMFFRSSAPSLSVP